MPQKIESRAPTVTLQTGEVGRYRYCYSVNSFDRYDVIIDTTTGNMFRISSDVRYLPEVEILR